MALYENYYYLSLNEGAMSEREKGDSKSVEHLGAGRLIGPYVTSAGGAVFFLATR